MVLIKNYIYLFLNSENDHADDTNTPITVAEWTDMSNKERLINSQVVRIEKRDSPNLGKVMILSYLL